MQYSSQLNSVMSSVFFFEFLKIMQAFLVHIIWKNFIICLPLCKKKNSHKFTLLTVFSVCWLGMRMILTFPLIFMAAKDNIYQLIPTYTGERNQRLAMMYVWTLCRDNCSLTDGSYHIWTLYYITIYDIIVRPSLVDPPQSLRQYDRCITYKWDKQVTNARPFCLWHLKEK